MGSTDLRTLAALSEMSFDKVSGSAIVVDTHNWLYRYLTAMIRWIGSEMYTADKSEEVTNLAGTAQEIPKSFERDLTPVLVFGSGVTEMKNDGVAKRREQRRKAREHLEEAREAGDAVEAAQTEARTQRLAETIQDTSRKLLSLFSVLVVEAPVGGEAQASYMAREGDADCVDSEDCGTLLFGVSHTLRQSASRGNPELMDLDATLDKHSIIYEQLIDIAVLCGTDFSEGVMGVDPEAVVEIATEHGDL